MESYNFCVWLLSLSVIFSWCIHVVECVSAPGVPLYDCGYCAIVWIYHTWFTHQLSGVWLVSPLGLLRWMLREHSCNFVWIYVSVLLEVDLEVELLGHMVILGLSLWGSSKGGAPICTPPACLRVPPSLCPHHHLLFSLFPKASPVAVAVR